jgi:putative membrane protein
MELTVGTLGCGLVALIHTYIVYLEMFLWATPRGRKTFRMTPEHAEKTKVLAANQGLYNGFLAAGLVWGITHPFPEFAAQIQTFFLGCVSVAGIYGSATVSRRILYVQAVPALLTLGAIYLGL